MIYNFYFTAPRPQLPKPEYFNDLARSNTKKPRHKIIPKRVEFLWSARNKTRVPQNIRKSIRSNSPTGQLISVLGDTCIYRFFSFFFFSCFFLSFSFFYFLRFLEVTTTSKDRETEEQAYTWPDSTVGPTCGATVSGFAANSSAGNPSGETKRAIVSKLPRVRRWGTAKTGDGLRNTEDYIRAFKRNKRIDDSRFVSYVFPFQRIISVLEYCR